MTVNDIIKSALALMGYGQYNVVGYEDKEMLQSALIFVNQIITDLGGKNAVNEIGDNVDLSPPALRAMPYGVAMLLALATGDTARNTAFGCIYNALRASVRGNISKITDTLPTSEVGV